MKCGKAAIVNELLQLTNEKVPVEGLTKLNFAYWKVTREIEEDEQSEILSILDSFALKTNQLQDLRIRSMVGITGPMRQALLSLTVKTIQNNPPLATLDLESAEFD